MRAPFHRNPDFDSPSMDWPDPPCDVPSLTVDVVVTIVKDDDQVPDRRFPFGFCRSEETA